MVAAVFADAYISAYISTAVAKRALAAVHGDVALCGCERDVPVRGRFTQLLFLFYGNRCGDGCCTHKINLDDKLTKKWKKKTSFRNG